MRESTLHHQAIELGAKEESLYITQKGLVPEE